MKPCCLCEHLVFFYMSAGLQVKKSYYNGYSCESRCNLSDPISYIWYKNEEKVPQTSRNYYFGDFPPSDVLSCAVKEHEDFPSPLKCEFTPLCFQCLEHVINLSCDPELFMGFWPGCLPMFRKV